MWNGMGAKSTLLILITSFTLFVVVLSGPTPKTMSSSASPYSRRINLRSKSPANLHLQTLRSSRQIPSPPALYSAPKEKEELKAQSPPSTAYGPPAVADDETTATTETATEEVFEGASTSAPESDGEVIEAENEVSSGTERTEYLPPPSNKRKLGRNRAKDQQMVETHPFHQIQIHVVPPHLSNQQDDHHADITSYGVPADMMMELGSRHAFQPQPESRQNGEYLPPQGRSADSSPSALRNEEQAGSYGPQPVPGREQDDQELGAGLDKTQPPSKEYETPRRDEPEPNTAAQIYQVPTAYSHSTTNINQNQQGYPTPSHGRAPQRQTQNQYRGQKSQSGYPAQQQNQGYSQSPSDQGYQQSSPQTEDRPQTGYSRNQQMLQFQQEYSQPQPQPQNQYRSQSAEPEGFHGQSNQILGQQQGYQSSILTAPLQYETPSQGGYQNQPSYPQEQYQGYSQNQVTQEDQPQDDAVIVQGFASPQSQPQQSQQGYSTTNQNQQSNYPQPPAQPQTYSPSPQQYFQPQPEIYSQPQQSTQQSPQSQYNEPQAQFDYQRSSSPQSSSYSPQPAPQNQYQAQPQSPAYDQQPLTSNSNLRQPQQPESFGSGNQYNSQGYPESRPQPQTNQSPAPTTSAQSQFPSPVNLPQGQSQYFQGNFFSQSPAQPQFRSNSLDLGQEEELEGLNGRIVDAALLARVQQIIEEHEREQKALLANFNTNSVSTSRSGTPSSEYGASFPSPPQQQNYQPSTQAQETVGRGQKEPLPRSGNQPQPGFGGESTPNFGGYSVPPATPTNNNGIQYQKAVLSQHFSETTPISNSQSATFPQPQQQSRRQHQSASPTSQSEGLRLVQAPQFGRQSSGSSAPQSQTRENIGQVPKPVYGVPLAPVIGLDSNDNFKVVDESLPDQGLGKNSYGAVELSSNFLQSKPRPFYGRNRRRVIGRVMKLKNISSPSVEIPSYFF